jgi:calcium-dependent protein kinase
VIDLGYAKDLHEKYILGKELGKGGNGLVTVAASRETGEEFACKAIKKVLDGDFSEQKKAGHVEGIKREVEVLRRLAGSLNIIKLVDVFEDEANVYLVQELCRGGELWHRIGERHYSERTVSCIQRGHQQQQQQQHSQLDVLGVFAERP